MTVLSDQKIAKESKTNNINEKLLKVNNDIKEHKHKCESDLEKLKEKKKQLMAEKRKLEGKK